VRFPAPVPTGSRVRGAVDLVSVDAVSGGVQGVLRVTIEADGQSRPACVADVVVRFYR
jgi:acyl dehydratase